MEVGLFSKLLLFNRSKEGTQVTLDFRVETGDWRLILIVSVIMYYVMWCFPLYVDML